VTRVVVVGAGIAGLAAAHRLRDAVDAAGRPTETVVVEAAAAVGGKLRVSEVGGLAVDEGAETFLARVPEAAELIRECGLGGQLVGPATTQAAVWARGSLRPLPTRTVLGVPSSVESLRGLLSSAERLRAAADRLLPGEPPGDEDVAVGEWVGRRLGRAVVERLVDPLLGGVYAGHADRLSLQATMPMLDRSRRSALAAAAASLPPPRAPGGAGDRQAAVFGTLTGGMGSLPAAVLAASGARLVSGRTVRRLERHYDGWRVVHGPTTDELMLEADAVIVAVPATAAARLLEPVMPAAAADLAGIEAASLAIVTTAWRRSDAGGASGSGYLVPAASRPRRPVKAVTFSSAKWAHLDTGDLVAVRCSIGRHGEAADLQRDDADLLALAVAELTIHAGFRGRPVDARVTRWGGGLPQYAVGHRPRVARVRAAVAGTPGLAVCGAAYDGVGVPACIRTGRQAAQAVLDHLNAPPG
jgi:oxygen-dependent protoporphyrinogen oxidase